mgnify:CR=1 FL=1
MIHQMKAYELNNRTIKFICVYKSIYWHTRTFSKMFIYLVKLRQDAGMTWRQKTQQDKS